MTTNKAKIPQPPPKWFIGNAGDIDSANLVGSFWHLAELYGEIFQLDLPNRKVVICNSYELVNELCDNNRFEKLISGPLEQVRALLKDGLFTAYPGEHNWGVAHRLLMPIFGPMGIRKMFGGMMDIAAQMLLRLTFDMIGLCGFGYRFNSFYMDKSHPFVDQMTQVLMESGKRANRLPIENRLRLWSAATTQENIAEMHKLTDEIIADRKKHPQPDSNDLLNPMLNGVDPQTGEHMTDESIRFNMVTFLVAGHQTTSGTMAFLVYHLLRNPDAYISAQKEVDEVLGDGPLEAQHIPKLKYIKACIYEALRYMGPIGVLSKHAKQDILLGGKYKVTSDTQLIANLRPFHHDPKVWGNDADTFRPERFLNGGYENLPPNAFKPFGDGDRACIGRAFAEQEMVMVMALTLQRFQIELVDPNYTLHVKVALTLKPADLKIRVRRRPGTNDSAGIGGATQSTTSHASAAPSKAKQLAMPEAEGKSIKVLYGSQAGTCKAYAEDLQTNTPRYGLTASIQTLDAATEHVSKEEPVIIIAPSYEGKPADNARKFASWLEANADSKILSGVNYAIFGVGNSDWAQTFHKIPKLIDMLFDKMGAKRFTKTGSVDVKYDIMGPWEEWSAAMLSDLRKMSGTTSKIETNELKAKIEKPKFATQLGGEDLNYGIVKKNVELGGSEVGLLKKHMEVELPEGVGYRAGDYIVVLPNNHPEIIKRVLRRFALSPDDYITISGTNKKFLSPDSPISIQEILHTRVELGTPASQKQIETLVKAMPEGQREALSRLTSDDIYQKEVLSKRFSVFDLLEDNPSCQLDFASFLDMLKPLAPLPSSRQRLHATITYDVHDEPAWSNNGRTFKGVASTYLASKNPGDKIRCFTRPTNTGFHLPTDPMVPIILVAAGTGVAPMRGFIQERAVIASSRNRQLGPALLYFGCRHHEKDFIYTDELRQWEKEDAVSVRPTFSKAGPEGCCKYVPDRMWEERKELRKLFKEQAAKFFVCGSASKLAKSTGDVCMRIYMEGTGEGEEEARKWLESVKEDRYVSDVFK